MTTGLHGEDVDKDMDMHTNMVQDSLEDLVAATPVVCGDQMQEIFSEAAALAAEEDFEAAADDAKGLHPAAEGGSPILQEAHEGVGHEPSEGEEAGFGKEEKASEKEQEGDDETVGEDGAQSNDEAIAAEEHSGVAAREDDAEGLRPAAEGGSPALQDADEGVFVGKEPSEGDEAEFAKEEKATDEGQEGGDEEEIHDEFKVSQGEDEAQSNDDAMSAEEHSGVAAREDDATGLHPAAEGRSSTLLDADEGVGHEPCEGDEADFGKEETATDQERECDDAEATVAHDEGDVVEGEGEDGAQSRQDALSGRPGLDQTEESDAQELQKQAGDEAEKAVAECEADVEPKEKFPNQLEAMLDGMLGKHYEAHSKPKTETQDTVCGDETASAFEVTLPAENDFSEQEAALSKTQSIEDAGARSSDEEGGAEEDEEEEEMEEEMAAVLVVEGQTDVMQEVEEVEVVKIQALARSKRDRKRTGLMGKEDEFLDDEGEGDTSAETTVFVFVAPVLHFGMERGGSTHAKEEVEEEEEEERPRLTFANPIEVNSSLAHAAPQEHDNDPPLPRLSFAARVKLDPSTKSPPKQPQQSNEADENEVVEKAGRDEVLEEGFASEAAPPVKLSFTAPAQKVKVAEESAEAPAVSRGKEEKGGVEEGGVTVGSHPAQSLDMWMAECHGNDTMDAERQEDNVVGEEEEDRRTGAAVSVLRHAPPMQSSDGSESAASVRQSPAVARASVVSHGAVEADRIMEGLQEKLHAVEDKVQELQQQLLANLSGGGDLEDGEEEGVEDAEEAVAALNERVEKLIRMRAQIMLAIEHQKTVMTAQPPSGTRSGTASPRARMLSLGASTLPVSHNNGYRPDPEFFPGANTGWSARRHGSARGMNRSPSHHENRVPPPMKIPKDLSLKPIRGTSKVPPAMFQRSKPPPPAATLYENYPEPLRLPSRELVGPAPIGAKAPKNCKFASYVGGPRVDRMPQALSPRATDYAAYSTHDVKDDDVKVSFRVLSDQRGSNVANRSHGRAHAIAQQEREMRFTKEQEVLKHVVRNQVSLEARYTKEVDRASKLQRINHMNAVVSSKGRSVFGAAGKAPF